MRILMNADPVEGGNTPAEAETPTAPPAEAVKPPEPAKPAPPTPPAPNPLLADLAALRAQLDEFERDKAERERLAREAEEEKLRNKGEFEKLIKQRDADLAAEREKAKAATDRAKSYALTTELALAFADHDLVEGSAEDLSELWRKDFEAVPDGDRWTVRSRDGRSVKDVVAERLAGRHSNHVKAQSRSGSGGGNGQVPAPTPNAKPAAPEDAFAKQLKAMVTNNRIGAPGLAGNYGTGTN